MITHISQSMLGQFDRCPEQFRRRYVENERIPPGIAARIGSGFHKGAEVNHKAKLITHEDEPLSVIQDAARDGYVHAVRDGGVFFPVEQKASAKIQIADGLDSAVKLAEVYHRGLAPKIHPVLVEQEITLAHPDLPVPFMGIVDVLDDEHWLPDIKTAEKKWANGRADHELQATLYWALVYEKTGRPPKKLSFEVFTRSKMEHQSNETTRTAEDWLLLIEKAKLFLRTVEAGIFMPAQPGSWICSPNYCGYWWTCPHIPSHRKVLPKSTV
jgi:hypothetical protein